MYSLVYEMESSFHQISAIRTLWMPANRRQRTVKLQKMHSHALVRFHHALPAFSPRWAPRFPLALPSLPFHQKKHQPVQPVQNIDHLPQNPEAPTRELLGLEVLSFILSSLPPAPGLSLGSTAWINSRYSHPARALQLQLYSATSTPR